MRDKLLKTKRALAVIGCGAGFFLWTTMSRAGQQEPTAAAQFASIAVPKQSAPTAANTAVHLTLEDALARAKKIARSFKQRLQMRRLHVKTGHKPVMRCCQALGQILERSTRKAMVPAIQCAI